MKASHVRGVLVIGLLYGVVNYRETKARGRPLYWFLTWEDYTTYVIYAALSLFFCTIWLLFAKLTALLKPRPTLK